MKLRLAPLLLLLFASPLPALHAEDLPRAKAVEEEAVRALLGKKAVITGEVTDTFESPKGMTFINLEGGKFTVVAWKESYDKFEGGSPAKLYKGKTLEITGEVFEYRNKNASKNDPGKLEIKLTSPDQIKILTPEKDAPDESGDKDADKSKGKKNAPAGKDKKAPAAEKPAGDSEEKTKEKPERVDPKKFFK